MNNGYNYVPVTSPGCKGFINLFYDDDCIALIDNVGTAVKIKSVTPVRIKSDGEPFSDKPVPRPAKE